MSKAYSRVAVAMALALLVGSVALAVKAEPKSIDVPQLAQVQPQRLDPARVFAYLDANKDGSVSREEFLSARRPGRNANTDDVKARREANFARLDADHDGKLTLAEFSAGRPTAR